MRMQHLDVFFAVSQLVVMRHADMLPRVGTTGAPTRRHNEGQ